MHACRHGMARKPTPVWAGREWYRPWLGRCRWPMANDGRWLMQGWDRQNKMTVKKMTVNASHPFWLFGTAMTE